MDTAREQHSQTADLTVSGATIVDAVPKPGDARNFVKRVALESGAITFTPRTVQALRAMIAQGVAQATPMAIQAMMGQRKWSHQQVQLFRTMLAKVVPDLEAKLVQGEILHRHVGELSKDDLLRLASEQD